MDYVKLFGQGHRKIMHDSRAIIYIYANYGPQAADVARGHIALDEVWSYSKRHVSKK